MDNNISMYVETMKRVAEIFNANNIRYALAGGVVAELRTGIVKWHKDVDFAVYEEDMPTIEKLLRANRIFCRNELVQLSDNDNWIDTTGHNTIGKDMSTGVDIGFFLYSNQGDEYRNGERVSASGFIRKTKIAYRGRRITLRERLNSELEQYLFDPNRIEELDGTKIKVQPLAYIMKLKGQNLREKDITDVANAVKHLNAEEREKYYRYRESIFSIKTTAQMGENATEGKCEEVKRLIELLDEEPPR